MRSDPADAGGDVDAASLEVGADVDVDEEGAVAGFAAIDLDASVTRVLFRAPVTCTTTTAALCHGVRQTGKALDTLRKVA